MKKDSIIRVGLAITPTLLFVLLFGLLGFLILLTPSVPVSLWGLTWRIAAGFACVGIIHYILSLGQRRKEVGLGYVHQVGPGEYRILSFFVFPDDFPDAKEGEEFMRNYAGMYFVVVGIRTVAESGREPMQLLRLPRVGQNEVRRWFNEPSQYRKTLVVDSEKPGSCELMGGAFSPLTCLIRMDADPSSF